MGDGRVGRYQVIRALAERAGGMWVLAKDPELDNALCVLHRVARSLTAEPFAYAEFLDRARSEKAFLHPNLVRALDVGTTGDDLLVVYEYVPGWSLEDVVNLCATHRHPLPLGFGCAALIDGLRGLEAAHRPTGSGGRALIHGQLDLSQVRIQPEGPAKVKGFAQVGPRAQGRYRSPEELRQEPLEPKSDVYSVGVMLYELLTGRPLFGETGEEVSGPALLYAPMASPRALNPDIPAPLAELVMKLLSRERQREGWSALEVARKLEVAAEPLTLSRSAREALIGWLDEKVKARAPEAGPVASLRPPRNTLPEPWPLAPPETITSPFFPAAESGRFWKTLALLAVLLGACVLAWTAYTEALVTTPYVPPPPPRPLDLPASPKGMPPEPLPEGPQAMGSIMLVTDPPAEVRFRGRLLGTTPLPTLELPLGVQRLELTLPSGQRKWVNVEVVESPPKGYRLDLSGP